MNSLRRLREAPVTAALITVNLLVYAGMAIAGGRVLSFASATLIDAGAVVAQPGVSTTAWRWLTAAFIHVNLPHIIMNLWVLSQIGVLSEKAVGRGLFASAYVVTGVLGNTLSAMLALSRGRTLLSAGASGAIMGLFGVAAVYAWRTGQKQIARSLAGSVAFVLVAGFVLTARGVVAVDNAAHIGGLLVGAVIGLLRARFPRPMSPWLDRGLIALSAVLALVAFLVVRAYGGMA